MQNDTYNYVKPQLLLFITSAWLRLRNWTNVEFSNRINTLLILIKNIGKSSILKLII